MFQKAKVTRNKKDLNKDEIKKDFEKSKEEL